MDDNKARYAQKTDARKLADIIAGADIFLGLSAARAQRTAQQMADNRRSGAGQSEPEIMSDLAKQARPMPSSPRGVLTSPTRSTTCCASLHLRALDVGATTINEAMKLAVVRAIADLAMAEQSDIVMLPTAPMT
jgi:malate dehydrogenase (oxaloacetate-decarboxylating)(NADP+)